MVFGADKLPGIAKGLGKGMRQLRDATDDIKREIQKSAEKQGLDADITSDIKKVLSCFFGAEDSKTLNWVLTSSLTPLIEASI